MAVKQYDDFQVGQSATRTRTLTENDIQVVSGLSGDRNPLHVDEEFARRTPFGRRLVHGILALGLTSAALTALGIGLVYVSQQIRFRRPVFIGDTLTARVEIVEKLPEKQRLRVRTICTNEMGEIVNEGEAVLQCMAFSGQMPEYRQK